MALGLYVGVGFVLGFVVGVFLTIAFGSQMVDRTIQQRFDAWEDEDEKKTISRFFGFEKGEDDRQQTAWFTVYRGLRTAIKGVERKKTA